MTVYLVTHAFSAPQLGVALPVFGTIGKIASRVSCLIGGVEYTSRAFYDWVGSTDSLTRLLSTGVLPDPALPGVPNMKSGSQAITSGESDVTVAGAAWGFVPTGIAAVIVKPAGGDNLFATVRSATITADGFTADLSAPASGAGYILYFIVMQ
jgi:hypothetical protein